MTESNVSIRFSVQDAEVVRQALTQLGADGEAALKKLDAAGQAPSAGLTALSKIMGDLKNQVVGFAVPLGPLGSGLIALGPAGVAAAAGLGLLITAFSKAAEMADALANKAIALQSLSDTTGLTTDQIQALTDVSAKAGKTADEVGTAIERFTVNWEDLRKGSGQMLDQMRQIDPALAEQMARARDTATAINVLAQAYDNATTQEQKNRLAQAAFGRNGVALGNVVLSGLTDSGGLNQLGKDAAEAGDLINRDLIARLVDLQAQINQTKQNASNIFASIFAESDKQKQLEFAQLLERIAKALKDISESDAGAALDRWFTSAGKWLDQQFGTEKAPAPLRITVSGNQFPEGVPMPRSRPSGADFGNTSSQFDLASLRQGMAILGAAASPAEQLKLKFAEIDAAIEKAGGQYSNFGARAKDALSAQSQALEISTKERLGISDVTDRMTQFDLDWAKVVRDYPELESRRTEALALYTRQVEQTMRTEAERKSTTPQLTQLSIEAADLKQQLDSGLSSALKGTTSDMISMAEGTVTLSDGLTSMAKKLAEAVAQALLMKAVVAPIAGGLSSFLGGLSLPGSNQFTAGNPAAGAPAGYSGASALGNVFDRRGLMRFAMGGIVTGPTLFPFANGTGLMGEAGPEAIMPLRRLPSGQLGVGGGGGSPVEVHIHHEAGSTASTTSQSTNSKGGPRIDVMVTNILTSALKDRGHPITRGIAQTFSLNKAAGLS